MVIVILESFVIMLTTFFVCSQAFWWSSPTTESTPVVKQIPVGYFRTYTYQPLSYPPSYYPYGGSHHSFTAGSGPFGSWSQRQSFSNNPPSPPGLSALKLTAPPPAPITTQPPPPPPQPTQPPTQSPPPQYVHINPPTSQSQTASVQPQPYSNLPIVEAHPPSPSSPNIQLQSSPASQIMNNGFPSSHSLPHYYQSSSPNQDPSQNYHHYYSANLPVQQIQFVPCMCPVSVSVSSEFPENRSDHLVEDESLLERSDQNLKEETH